MNASTRNRFALGLLGGAVSATLGALALLYALTRTELATQELANGVTVPAWFGWVDNNLGLSLPVFVLIAVAFMYTLETLAARVRRHEPLDRIAQLDHLTDIWISLFFGTGVIWTAIGMRNALLFALGDPAATLDAGPLALLDRMVNGGILVALSTTIFGGVGGYLMRVIKTVTVGAQLKRCYTRHSRADSEAIQSSLNSMNRHLEGLAAVPKA